MQGAPGSNPAPSSARGHLVFYRHKSCLCFGDNKSSHSSLSLFLIIVNLGHAPPCFLVWLYIFLHYRYHFLPMMSAKKVKIIWMRIQFVLAMLQKHYVIFLLPIWTFLKLVHVFLYVRYFVRYFRMISRQFGMKILFTFLAEKKKPWFGPIRSLFI